METEMLKDHRKALAELFVTANQIEVLAQKNISLGRAIVNFSQEFENRDIAVPLDGDENIFFLSNLAEMELQNNNFIAGKIDMLIDMLSTIAKEYLNFVELQKTQNHG